MDWGGRLGRIGVLAGAAGAAACGRTIMSRAPGPSQPAAACSQPPRPTGTGTIATLSAPASRLTLAIAEKGVAGIDSELPVEARALLSEIAAALAAHCAAAPSDSLPSDTVVVRRVQDFDARDALDQDVGVLVTRDRPVEAYAASHTGFAVVPLSWDRTYVLVVAGGQAAPDSAGTSIRASLAADAIHAEARPVGLGGGLESDAVCEGHPAHGTVLDGLEYASARRPRDATHVVFDAADPVARFLAERVAVLASTRSPQLSAVAPALDPSGAEMSVTALSPGAFTLALQDGQGAAFVVAILSTTSLSCAAAPTTDARSDGVRPGIIPLIETRAVAIVRLDLAGRVANAARSANIVVDGGRAP